MTFKQHSLQRLYWLFTLVLILPNVVLLGTEGMGFWAALASVAMPLAVYMLAMTAGQRIGRTVMCLFPFLFLGAFQMVLTYLYGRGPIAVDMWLNLVTTNSGEVGELLSQLIPAIVWVVVIYVPTIALAIFLWVRRADLDKAFIRRRRLHALCATTAAAILTAAVTVATDFAPTSSMFPLNACCNLGMAFGREKASARYMEASAPFRFYARSTDLPTDTACQTIVCVVGETSRADNWQLYGYRRQTNPLLAKTEGLTVFTDYMSQSNTTHKSVPILLSLASAEDYDILFHTKGIMQAYREAGWHTVYISNQQRNHSFIDFLGEQADDHIFLHDNDKPGLSAMAPDGQLLPTLKGQLKKRHRRLFVVLHTYGSHFNYADRYPATEAHFQPATYDGAKPQYRPMMINAYDNSIRYTDWLLHSVIAQLRQRGGQTAMLYTADHGEDIFDDHRHLFLHASPFPSFYQLHVPMLVWTSQAYAAAHASEVQALRHNSTLPASSSCVFHTLLSLGHISTSYLVPELSLASKAFAPQRQRLFIDDHNTPLTYRQCMQEEDLKLMQLKHITYE